MTPPRDSLPLRADRIAGTALELTGERTLPGIPRENYWFRRHVAAYRFARRMASGWIVDAGAGEGYGAAILAGRGSVVAVDLDAATARHAARRYGVRAVQGDLCRLPLAEGSADALVALQVLEHIPCAVGFLESCRSVLRHGGVLVLSTPNRETFPAGENPFHVHEYDAGELHGMLAGRFGDVRLLGVRHGRPLRMLDRALGEPVQHRLARTPYPSLPLWLRAILRTVRVRDFVISGDPVGALDLLAVCR